MNKIQIKRIYDKVEKNDGIRILIDRLWPRGIKKSEAAIDLWLKNIAPSNELRKLFAHDREKWVEFKKNYIAEIKDNKDSLAIIKDKLKKSNITLLYGTKDTECNNAVVLQEYLSQI